MVGNGSDFPELVADVYEAALDGDVWQAVVDRLGTRFSDGKITLWLEDRLRGEGTVLGCSGYELSFLESYMAHYANCNPWLQNKKGSSQLGVHTTDQLCGRRELLRSEFYADWLRPQAIEGGFGANVFNDDRRFMFLSILRDGRAGEADEVELALLERLRPHLERAIHLSRQIAGGTLLQEALLGALDRLPNGFVVLGAGGRVAAMNRQAEDLVRQRDGLTLRRDGTLVAERPQDTIALKQMVAGALSLQQANGQEPAGSGGVMLVPRRGRRPLQVLVSPLPWRGRSAGAGLVGLFIHDPETRIAPPSEQLRSLYGLSPAEACLATALAEGESLKTYAEVNGVTLETARSRLKQVMAKMDVHRQADLVRAVLAMPMMAAAGDGAHAWGND